MQLVRPRAEDNRGSVYEQRLGLYHKVADFAAALHDDGPGVPPDRLVHRDNVVKDALYSSERGVSSVAAAVSST